jgi:hypothetical protein
MQYLPQWVHLVKRSAADAVVAGSVGSCNASFTGYSDPSVPRCSWLINVLFAIYILIIGIMLLNILIAIFR